MRRTPRPVLRLKNGSASCSASSAAIVSGPAFLGDFLVALLMTAPPRLR
jgi:hypothetical protein